MTSELSKFAARLREFIHSVSVGDDVRSLISPNPNLLETPHVVSYGEKFNARALELFALQFTHNAPYRRICEGRGVSPTATFADSAIRRVVGELQCEEFEGACVKFFPVGDDVRSL